MVPAGNGGRFFSMTTPNDGRPAFPQHGWTTNPEVLDQMKNQGGMTLRDWFAGQALAGICASTPNEDAPGVGNIADWSYQQADAMLKARAK